MKIDGHGSHRFAAERIVAQRRPQQKNQEEACERSADRQRQRARNDGRDFAPAPAPLPERCTQVIGGHAPIPGAIGSK
jgi:hypothetical protein